MCFSIAKYLLFAFNFLFWLAGGAVLGLGIWMSVDPDFSDAIKSAGVEYAIAGPAVFIATGCVMLIFGFFGCCGAIKESTCLLSTYAVLLFIVLGLEVGIGIWAFVYYDSVDQAVQDGMTEVNKVPLINGSVSKTFTSTQTNLKCCGVTEGCTDWENNEPIGCGCDPKDEHCIEYKLVPGCNGDSSGMTGVYNQTCVEATTNFVQNNMMIIGVVGLVIGLAELIGIIFACCLCQSIKKKESGHLA